MNPVWQVTYSRAEIEGFMNDDVSFVKLANEGREKLSSSPAQSHFKVYAILVVEKVDGSLCLVHGANSEQGYIGGAICAERSALCALRFIEKPIVRHVVVVTDSATPTSPGVLCREYLMSHTQPEVHVVMGNATSDHIINCQLRELWPHPYLYRFADRSDVVEAAKLVSELIKDDDEVVSAVGDDIRALRSHAMGVNYRDALDALHPIRFSAAVMFEDGTVETAWMLKGLEYGCTLDPVSQLVHQMEKRKLCAPCTPVGSTTNVHQAGLHCKPTLLIMCDQFGVAHAPFAQARSILYEHGYEYLRVAVHDVGGTLHTTSVLDLVPQPTGTNLVACDDFH